MDLIGYDPAWTYQPEDAIPRWFISIRGLARLLKNSRGGGFGDRFERRLRLDRGKKGQSIAQSLFQTPQCSFVTVDGTNTHLDGNTVVHLSIQTPNRVWSCGSMGMAEAKVVEAVAVSISEPRQRNVHDEPLHEASRVLCPALLKLEGGCFATCIIEVTAGLEKASWQCPFDLGAG